MAQASNKYDLGKRTARFGESVIIFCKRLGLNTFNRNIVDQLLRAATSIGANYAEANGASSKLDFRNKIHIAKKEARENKHWLRMLGITETTRKAELRNLWQEAHELVLIFIKNLVIRN